MINFITNRILPWIMPVSILLIWQFIYEFKLLPEVILRNISSPKAVLFVGWQLSITGELWIHIYSSAKRAVLGFILGGGIGFILGILTGISFWLRQLLDSTLQMLRNIPNLALIPLIIVWLGVDETAKITLVALGTFFPIYLNTYHGIRNVDRDLIEMAKSYGLSKTALFKDVLLPGAMPNVLIGMRFSLGIMWLTLIVAETIAADSGIGYLAIQAREFFQIDIILFSILVYALLGIFAEIIAKMIEKRLLRWNPIYQTKQKSEQL